MGADTEVAAMVAVEEDTEVAAMAAVDMVVEDTKEYHHPLCFSSFEELLYCTISTLKFVTRAFNCNSINAFCILSQLAFLCIFESNFVFRAIFPMFFTTMKLISDIVDGVWILTSDS